MFQFDLLDSDNTRVDVRPYPAARGLFPCLVDTDGGYVRWRMDGDPDNWTTVRYRSGNLVFFDCGITQLICEWIEHKGRRVSSTENRHYSRTATE